MPWPPLTSQGIGKLKYLSTWELVAKTLNRILTRRHRKVTVIRADSKTQGSWYFVTVERHTEANFFRKWKYALSELRTRAETAIAACPLGGSAYGGYHIYIYAHVYHNSKVNLCWAKELSN